MNQEENKLQLTKVSNDCIIDDCLSTKPKNNCKLTLAKRISFYKYIDSEGTTPNYVLGYN